MAKNLRIDVAYCVELKRVVDIHDACAAFFGQHEHERFHFLCSDENCRDSRPGGVRVTAVNHYRIPTERERSAHYRELDPHSDNCYWKELELALQEEEEAPAPADEIEKARRRVARKVTRLVTNSLFRSITPARQAVRKSHPRLSESGKSPTHINGDAPFGSTGTASVLLQPVLKRWSAASRS